MLNAGISKIHCTLPPYYIMLVESRQLEKDSYMQGIIFQYRQYPSLNQLIIRVICAETF